MPENYIPRLLDQEPGSFGNEVGPTIQLPVDWPRSRAVVGEHIWNVFLEETNEGSTFSKKMEKVLSFQPSNESSQIKTEYPTVLFLQIPRLAQVEQQGFVVTMPFSTLLRNITIEMKRDTSANIEGLEAFEKQVVGRSARVLFSQVENTREIYEIKDLSVSPKPSQEVSNARRKKINESSSLSRQEIKAYLQGPNPTFSRRLIPFLRRAVGVPIITIAEEVGFAESTIKREVSDTMQDLGMTDLQIIFFALEEGLCTLPEIFPSGYNIETMKKISKNQKKILDLMLAEQTTDYNHITDLLYENVTEIKPNAAKNAVAHFREKLDIDNTIQTVLLYSFYKESLKENPPLWEPTEPKDILSSFEMMWNGGIGIIQALPDGKGLQHASIKAAAPSRKTFFQLLQYHNLFVLQQQILDSGRVAPVYAQLDQGTYLYMVDTTNENSDKPIADSMVKDALVSILSGLDVSDIYMAEKARNIYLNILRS